MDTSRQRLLIHATVLQRHIQMLSWLRNTIVVFEVSRILAELEGNMVRQSPAHH